ncbi:hypothetical protein KDN24_00140 [Bacillus sp. Bva_UNVM-123]|uniref:hypothetical protein n=1 Tax=Bacillus sp. Bva_UNVM-123 TaxID=2829798 RepID=UPI00391EEEC3
MKKLYLIILSVFIFSIVHLQNPIHILAKDNYLFPDNKEKQFISAEEYFLNGSLTNYTEYKEADINFRQKLLYKDLKSFIKSKVTDYYYINLYNVYADPHSGVSPNRQVYFYCSILNTDKSLKYKYIILDAETFKQIVKGDGTSFKFKD